MQALEVKFFSRFKFFFTILDPGHVTSHRVSGKCAAHMNHSEQIEHVMDTQLLPRYLYYNKK
jgi:hypothetical protein